MRHRVRAGAGFLINQLGSAFLTNIAVTYFAWHLEFLLLIERNGIEKKTTNSLVANRFQNSVFLRPRSGRISDITAIFMRDCRADYSEFSQVRKIRA